MICTVVVAFGEGGRRVVYVEKGRKGVRSKVRLGLGLGLGLVLDVVCHLATVVVIIVVIIVVVVVVVVIVKKIKNWKVDMFEIFFQQPISKSNYSNRLNFDFILF